MSGVGLLVVVVSYRTRDLTLDCVESVLAHGDEAPGGMRVVVVDNASGDGTPENLRQRFGGGIDVLVNPRNVGYGAACNQGAAVDVTARDVLFLNADTRAEAGAIRGLVAALEETAGAVLSGPGLSGSEGEPRFSVRGHPTPSALLHQHTALRFLRFGAGAYRRYKKPQVAPESAGPAVVDVVNGAVLLVRAEAFRAVGGFDPRYFLYFEEADLCRRLADAGGRCVWARSAGFRHVGGASSTADSAQALVWYLTSLFLYVDRFHGRRFGLLFRAAFKPLFLVRMLTDALRDVFAWMFKPGRRSDKQDEMRLAARFFTRGMWTFLGA